MKFMQPEALLLLTDGLFLLCTPPVTARDLAVAMHWVPECLAPRAATRFSPFCSTPISLWYSQCHYSRPASASLLSPRGTQTMAMTKTQKFSFMCNHSRNLRSLQFFLSLVLGFPIVRPNEEASPCSVLHMPPYPALKY